MNIYIFSDECSTFDKKHYEYFVFGGVICFSQSERNSCTQKYIETEKDIRAKKRTRRKRELKASHIKNKVKVKLYRSVKQCYKFGVIVHQLNVLNYIFNNKKDKQRYLDYVYKIAVKRAFEDLIERDIIIADDVEELYFYVDEHPTATDGCYELCLALEQELKYSSYISECAKYYPPIFKQLKKVEVRFCNSKSVALIRAADIIASRIYYKTLKGKITELSSELFICQLP